MKKKLNCLSSVLFVLLMTFSALMAGINYTEAQTTAIQTFLYLSVSPNPVGVGQQIVVQTWITPYNPYSYINRFHGITLTITKPDGTRETKGPFDLDVNQQNWQTYTPNALGNYTFKATYSGEILGPGQFLQSESPTTRLVVQQEPIQPYQDTPLPTNYWTRPINGQNRFWTSISGDWLMTAYNLTYTTAAGVSVGAFNPYSQAPKAPHVMWTREIMTGGLVGGDQGANFYYSGPSYSSQFSPPIVMDGKLYYNINSRAQITGFICVDLRTGQEIWENNDGKSLACGQEWNAQKYGYTTAGVMPYLWTTTWEGYDPATGKLMFNFTNYATYTSSLSRPIFSDDGSMLVYTIGRSWLAMWNSSRVSPSKGTYDWSKGLQWNVTIADLRIPTSLYPILNISSSRAPSILSAWGNVLIGSVRMGSPGYNVVYDMGYDLTTGQELWISNYTQSILDLGGPTYWHAIGDGVHAEFIPAQMRWNGYDVNTGKLLWVSDPQDYPWGVHESYYPTIAYGKLYSLSYDGCIHAFDVKTGKEVWKFSSGNSGIETPSGTYPFFYGPIIADGVIFASNGYETPYPPLVRGAKVFAVDASTGEELWNMNGMMYLRAIADGYLLGVNVYDSQLYCIGKGPSRTTVTAPQVGVTTSTPVTIAGTVTDICAGSQQNAVAANFPNGLPCVSDESQGAWMSYVYEQQPKPTNASGVTVFLQAIQSDGTVMDIWHAKSDTMGHYEYTWTPPDAGTYKIVATFEGSESYWRSSGECGLSVGPAATTINVPSANDVAGAVVGQLPATATPVPTAPSANDVANQVVSQLLAVPAADNTLLIAVAAAVVVAILIGVVNLVLQVRKKK